MKKHGKKILSAAVILFLFQGILIHSEELPEKIMDGFETSEGWEKVLPEGPALNLVQDKGVKGNSIRLDFDFGQTKLFVVAGKKFDLTLPRAYQFTFYVRGECLKNNLEFKLIDPNDNVYWKKWENFSFSKDWKKITVTNKDISFAWGPSPQKRPTKIAKIEFGVSGGEGGTGTVNLDELTFGELPSDESPDAYLKVKSVKASSFEGASFGPEGAIDDNMQTRWASQFSDPQWLELDLGEPKEFVGLVLNWEAAFGKSYEILISDNGTDWASVYSTEEGDGETDDVYFQKKKARYIKLTGKKRGTSWGYSLWETAVKGPDEEIIMSASSSKESQKAGNALDGNLKTSWHSGEKEEGAWIQMAFKRPREIGGLFLTWGADAPVSYRIKSSLDGKEWAAVYKTDKGNGWKDKIYIDKTKTKFIRIECEKSAGKKGYELAEAELKGGEESATPERLYEVRAEDSPDGFYPRWISKKQSYWTVMGVEIDPKESLMSEDGDIEADIKSFSVMPYLYIDEKLVTRSEAKVSQGLEKNYLPLPKVTWDYGSLAMEIDAFAYGKSNESVTAVRYRIKNNDAQKAAQGKLFLTVRPFQVNPPWQEGGLSRIRSIGMKKDVIVVNGQERMFLSKSPDRFGAVAYKEGDVTDFIRDGKVPPRKKVEDPGEFSSAAIEYNFKLDPGKSADFVVDFPFYNPPSFLLNAKEKKSFDGLREEVIKSWESRVSNLEIDIPDPDLVNTFKSNIAYILINKDGNAIQPGSRRYQRSWIRDGSVTSSALLKVGIVEEVRNYLKWYTSFLYKNGKVPCVVDKKGADPTDEFDSQGEYIYAILQYYEFTRDKNFLQENLEPVVKAMKYMAELASRRRTKEYKEGPADKRKFYGLFPESISHEGYVPPMHSYWDDFWGLKGWKDGKTIAQILERRDLIDWTTQEESEFRKSLYDSIRLVISSANIDYIPACAEKADFDPTSTSIAVMVCDEYDHLPQPQLEHTYDRYHEDIVQRMKPDWLGGYTPYEIRTVQALLYMGQKKRAHELLGLLLSHRRPKNWNHLAEVVHSDYRAGKFIGDMPHTWIGSEYVNAIRSLFIYEKGDTLVLGHGILDQWLDRKEGVSIKNFPTYFGKVGYTIVKEGNKVKASISGDMKGKIILKSPFELNIRGVEVNGKSWNDFTKDSVTLNELPAEVTIFYE